MCHHVCIHVCGLRKHGVSARALGGQSHRDFDFVKVKVTSPFVYLHSLILRFTQFCEAINLTPLHILRSYVEFVELLRRPFFE